MSVQIDDAGWGCLVGGMAIGCYRVGTGEFEHGLVAPRFFQGRAWEGRAYLAEAAEVAAGCLARLAVSSEEPVEVCSGWALEGIRRWLDERGYAWTSAKIRGPLQEQVERAFWRYLTSLGFEVDFDLATDPTRRGLFWWQQVAWLKGGDVDAAQADPARAAVCKTGWASYDIWANHPYGEARRLARWSRRRRRGEGWPEVGG
jgi:hypothetical protein